MGILIHTVFIAARAMTIAQITRHLAKPTRMDIGQRRIDRSLTRIGLRRQTNIERSLREVNTALGIANNLGRFKRSMRHQKRLRVGVANVLRGMNHNATGDKLRILPCIDHARKPVDRGIGVATAHGLDERTDDVVVHVAVFVIRKAATRVAIFTSSTVMG